MFLRQPTQGDEMKIYLKFVLLLFLFASSYGFIVPSLVSARDSIAVFAGFLFAVVIAPAMLFAVGQHIYKKHIKKDQEK